jgi:putative transcriptional regulator
MEKYRSRSGDRMTYERLAELTGLSRATLESLASRETYNTRLSTVEKVCTALNCQPGDLLELVPESESDVVED